MGNQLTLRLSVAHPSISKALSVHAVCLGFRLLEEFAVECRQHGIGQRSSQVKEGNDTTTSAGSPMALFADATPISSRTAVTREILRAYATMESLLARGWHEVAKYPVHCLTTANGPTGETSTETTSTGPCREFAVAPFPHRDCKAEPALITSKLHHEAHADSCFLTYANKQLSTSTGR